MDMTLKTCCVTAAIVVGMAAPTVVAHHSFSAEFDITKTVKVTGKVSSVRWSNPHAWIYIDVKEDGKVANWGFELASPNGLMRSGWTRFSLKPGDVVTIEGSRAKNGSTNANAQVITMGSTGQKLFSGANPQAPQ